MKYWKALLAIAAIVVVAVLFFVLKPNTSNSDNNTTNQTIESRAVQLNIVDGKLSNGQGTISVKQGQKVTLEVTADTTDELHIHGYDKSVELKPSVSKSVTFTADKSGSFDAELHGTDSLVFVLEVQPE